MVVKVNYHQPEETEGNSTDQQNALYNDYEIRELLTHTGRSLQRDVERKLGSIACSEHRQQPVITINVRYNRETEQMDVDYDVDTCCQMFLQEIIHKLNTTN